MMANNGLALPAFPQEHRGRGNTMPGVVAAQLVWGTVRESVRRLVEAILDLARQSVELIQLTVVSDNEEARGLYTKLGFVEYGLEKNALKFRREPSLLAPGRTYIPHKIPLWRLFLGPLDCAPGDTQQLPTAEDAEHHRAVEPTCEPPQRLSYFRLEGGAKGLRICFEAFQPNVSIKYGIGLCQSAYGNRRDNHARSPASARKGISTETFRYAAQHPFSSNLSVDGEREVLTKRQSHARQIASPSNPIDGSMTKAMMPVRRCMIEDMKIRNMSPLSQAACVRAVGGSIASRVDLSALEVMLPLPD